MAKLKPRSIRFEHPYLPHWNGDVQYKTVSDLREAVANLEDYVPQHVRKNLTVTVREKGDEVRHEI